MAEDMKNFSAWMRAADIQSSVSRCADLFNCGIFNANGTASILFEAAATHLLVHLNDLLQKANLDGKRISFVEDVEISESIYDVTELVRTCRNSACHVTSGTHKIDSVKFTFCVASGIGPAGYVINGKEMGCDYADDIAIYYGANRVYLKRHLLRSFELVAQIYRTDGHW